jgi:hypothetical protein
MRTLALLLTTVCFASVASSARADAVVVPANTVLVGPGATQRLLVLQKDAGKIVGDRTGQAKFGSSNPAVATVDESGIVRAVGDGEAIISATAGGMSGTATVKVTGMKQPAVPSFRNHVIPMMTKIGCNSGACHGALAGKGGLKLSLRGYAPSVDHFVLTRQANGRRVDLLDPAHSLMLLKPTMAVPHGGGQKLEPDSADYHVIADWIANGAPAPKEEDARIQRLEVFPPEAVLKPQDHLQVLVRAHYSDGHSQDVTHWVKFNSNEDLVATVDTEGKVTVAGHGEAAITIWYSNLVATARIVSPLPNQLDPAVFTKAERKNAIDDLVLKKLAALRIPPSPLCTDAEFIRRAYLDATGTLPTPDEVAKFASDKSLDKRAKLIDALLEKPEFVDYWTYKWADLLLISTRRLPQPATWAFYQFVRQSVADNKPWDRFARDVLTASGNSLQNGAVNYFVLHKDISDLTEATSLTFMGMSITCCRCHNHPLEKWTQDQYWSMANLFSRVAFKNADRGGEVSVQAQPSGDIPHLRRGIAMPPTPLDYKPMPLDSSADRRKYFADWLTAPDNAYFAKALVNRVWRNFLGRGLVEAEDDLRQTNPPTNEELFDSLAKDFVAHKFDVKYLMRTIMNSATYQRSSKPTPENVTDDRFYSHYLVKRLPAEVILDAYSQVTGVPTPFNKVVTGVEGGTADYKGYPPGTRALQLPDSLVASRFLDSFGRPERVQTCSCERQQESSITQALHLNNGQTLNDKLRDKGCRTESWLKENVNDEEAIKRVYQLALCRTPNETELSKCRSLMSEGQPPRREALEDLFWAVLTSKEFLFNR